MTATGPDPGCVVQVRDRTVTDRPSFGTGYLIGPGIVLTAAHVVPTAGEERSAAITVGAPGQESAVGDVVWWRKGEQVDAALIRIPAVNRAGLPRPPTRYGSFISSVPGQSAEAIGFPRLQKFGSARDQEHIDGILSPLTGAVSGRYELASKTSLPGPAPDKEKVSWAGMSGAAVFSNGLLVGIVRSDRMARVGARLIATPMAELLADQEFQAIVSVATGWNPVCEPVELSGILESPYRDRDTRSVAALLRAEAETVGFHGRAAETERLESWCAAADPLAMLVVTGQGGEGKSRLVRQFLAVQRARGWITGVLRPGTEEDITAELRSGVVARSRQPLLIAVDYAENRLREVRALIGQARAARGKVRLLLVARDREALVPAQADLDAGIRDLFAGRPELALPPLITTHQEWADAFSRAVKDLATALPGVPGYEEVDWPAAAVGITQPEPAAKGQDAARRAQLKKMLDAFAPGIPPGSQPEGPDYEDIIDWSSADAVVSQQDPAVGLLGSVLSAHMAALAALVEQASPLAAGRREPVERTLLRHEEAYWTTVARRCGLRLDRTTLRSSVAALAVVTVADQDQAITLLGALIGGSADQGRIGAQWLRELYPRRESRYLGTVQPDRLAEFLLVEACAEKPDLLARIMSAAANCGDPRVLAEVESEWGADPASSYPQMAALLAAVLAARSQARLGNPAGPLLHQIEAMASQPVISDETLQWAISNVLASSAQVGPEHLTTNADGKTVLARDVNLVAPLDAGLAALQVAGFRRGVHTWGKGGVLNQAFAHEQHSMSLRTLGRIDEALEESSHALDSFRAAPGARVQLADHLHSHAQLLLHMDRDAEAAEFLCEEVELRKPADWPRHPLPAAFETLVGVLLRTGHNDRARTYAERAVIVLRPPSPTPTRDQAEGYLRARGAHADVLAAAGALTEALASCSHAEAFIAALPVASRDALIGEQAALHVRRAQLLTRIGDHAGSAAAWLEGAKEWERLDKPYRSRDPVVQAVTCLFNAAVGHTALRNPATALTVIREASRLADGDQGQALRRDHPELCEHVHAGCVAALVDAGQPEQAVSEAEKRWNRAVPTGTAACQLLADCLGGAQRAFAVAGRFADAVRAGRIVVTVLQELDASADTPERTMALAGALIEYSGCLAKAGHLAEGARTGTRAAAIWRRLCTEEPQLVPHMVDALTNQGECLRLDSKFAEAADVFAEAAGTLRETMADSAAERVKLAQLLERQAHCEGRAGHRDTAVQVLAQVAELRQEARKALADPSNRREDPNDEIRALRMAVDKASNHADRGYAQSLLAIALWRRSHSPDSQPADLDEAVTSCRECLASWPPCHPKRPTVLYTLGAVLKERYDRDAQPADLDGAVSAGREAISARKPSVPNTAYGMTLGEALWVRFKRNRQRADLDELIDVMQETIDAVPPSHRDHGLAARNLALALTERATLTNQLQHVDQALQANRYLLEILPSSAPQRAEAQLEVENILRWSRFMHPDA